MLCVFEHDSEALFLDLFTWSTTQLIWASSCTHRPANTICKIYDCFLAKLRYDCGYEYRRLAIIPLGHSFLVLSFMPRAGGFDPRLHARNEVSFRQVPVGIVTWSSTSAARRDVHKYCLEHCQRNSQKFSKWYKLPLCFRLLVNQTFYQTSIDSSPITETSRDYTTPLQTQKVLYLIPISKIAIVNEP
jgi:hypothetical protein